MASQYPLSIDVSLPIVVDNRTAIDEKLLNNFRSCIIAIESELGLKPSGIYGTVRERLTAMELIFSSGGLFPADADRSIQINNGGVFGGMSWVNPVGTDNLIAPLGSTQYAKSVSGSRDIAVWKSFNATGDFDGPDALYIGSEDGYSGSATALRLWANKSVSLNAPDNGITSTFGVAQLIGPQMEKFGGIPVGVAGLIVIPNIALHSNFTSGATLDTNIFGGGQGVLRLGESTVPPTADGTDSSILTYVQGNNLRARHTGGSIRTLSPYLGMGTDANIGATGDIRLPAEGAITLKSGDGYSLSLIGHHTYIGDAFTPDGEVINIGTDADGNLSSMPKLTYIWAQESVGLGVGGPPFDMASAWLLGSGAFERTGRGWALFPNMAMWNSSPESDIQYNNDTTFCGGTGVFFFGQVGDVPVNNPTRGIALYVQDGYLKYRRPDGYVVNTGATGGGGGSFSPPSGTGFVTVTGSSLDTTATANVRYAGGKFQTDTSLQFKNATITGDLAWTPTSTNKTLTLPDATDTLIGRATTDTLTNKTIDVLNNTLTSTGIAVGDLLLSNGTKFLRKAKGSDGYFLGVSGGVVDYYLPPAAAIGGSSGQVQFNNAGVFGGASHVSYDGTNLKLTSDLQYVNGSVVGDLSWVPTVTNKTLTLPDITDTLVARTSTDTLTNKTINVSNNTLTVTSIAAGDLLLSDGTKFIRQAKGSNGTFLGVSGGSVGYFSPSATSAFIFDSGSPAENGRTARATAQSHIDNTKQGIVNLSSDTTGAASGATADFAAILSGNKNSATDGYTVVVGGLNNTAANALAVVLGGQDGLTKHVGQIVSANKFFATQGDAQQTHGYHLKGLSVAAAPVVLTDSSGAELLLQIGFTYAIRATILAQGVSPSGGSAMWVRTLLCSYHDIGHGAIIDNNDSTLSVAGGTGWTIGFTITSSTTLRATFTGAGSANVHAMCCYEFIEIGGGG